MLRFPSLNASLDQEVNAMFARRKLACSFCGKSAAEVSKLVAGPNVYICDACVATATRIMNEPGSDNPSLPPATPGVWRRLSRWIAGRVERSRHGEAELSAR